MKRSLTVRFHWMPWHVPVESVRDPPPDPPVPCVHHLVRGGGVRDVLDVTVPGGGGDDPGGVDFGRDDRPAARDGQGVDLTFASAEGQGGVTYLQGAETYRQGGGTFLPDWGGGTYPRAHQGVPQDDRPSQDDWSNRLDH